jgi:hypothetical protein
MPIRTDTIHAPAVPTDDLRAAVQAASLAPSLHNSQPWWFRIDEHGIDVHADPTRNPTAADPAGRELRIGCGAAILFARLALRELGWTVQTTLLPDPAEADHLARLTVTGREPATADEHSLVLAIPVRYTDRGRYDDRRVPLELVEQLRQAVSEEGAWLRTLDRPGDAVPVTMLLAHADEIERDDPAYTAELAAWSRYDAADDGVPRQAVDPVPVDARATTYPLRDFDVDGSVTAGYVAAQDPPPVERSYAALIGTPGDDDRSWLEAGAALGRLLLRAAVEGVNAQPMTQVLEVPAARIGLARELGVVGHPQMLLRLGYGTGRPITHRRSVDDLIR